MQITRSNQWPMRWRVLVGALVVAGIGAFVHLGAAPDSRERVAVGITGVQHIGPDYNIFEFHVAGYPGGNVGREGGGGSNMCCVILPKRWHSGMSVEVRWGVGDWRPGNVRQEPEGLYKARVPVEEYQDADRLYVHFFPQGRVKVVVGDHGPSTYGHQISRHDPHAAEGATKGIRMKDMFTEAELNEIDRRGEVHHRLFGVWR